MIAIWRSANISTLDLQDVYIKLKKIIERGSKKVSQKSMKRSLSQGYLNKPEDCCVIARCRHFLKAKSKVEIDLNECDCKVGDKIPDSRIEFFKSNLFDRMDKVMTIADLPTIPILDSIGKNFSSFFNIILRKSKRIKSQSYFFHFL